MRTAFSVFTLAIIVLIGSGMSLAASQVDEWYIAAEKVYSVGNYADALKLYGKAADWGDVQAQFKLGKMYYEGKGSPRNDTQAYIWSFLAAKQGHTTAARYRDAAANSLSPAQLNEAQKFIRDWRPQRK